MCHTFHQRQHVPITCCHAPTRRSSRKLRTRGDEEQKKLDIPGYLPKEIRIAAVAVVAVAHPYLRLPSNSRLPLSSQIPLQLNPRLDLNIPNKLRSGKSRATYRQRGAAHRAKYIPTGMTTRPVVLYHATVAKPHGSRSKSRSRG